MKNFLKHQNELLLGAAAVILLAVIVSIFVWGIGFLASNIGDAITSGEGKGTGMNFDLEGAKQLNLKGLAQ